MPITRSIEEEKQAVIEWLMYPSELGCKPKAIKYTKQFKTNDGIECKIFKYKKSMFSPWLLAISSESGIFSEMQRYNPSTEIEDATKLVEYLIQFWKNKANEFKEREIDMNVNYADTECSERNIRLSTDGPGIVLYADANMAHVPEGENFFSKEFQAPEKVAEHIQKGDIIGFNTGSSGIFNITVKADYPSENMLKEYPITIRLALDVKGGAVSIIDLFWLTEWSSDVPDEQKVSLPDGIYHVTIMTKKPDSNIWGDNQQIFMYFNRIDEMPQLTWHGVPSLFTDSI